MRKIKFKGVGSDGIMHYGRLSQDRENSTAYYDKYSQRICWSIGTTEYNIPVSNETLSQYTNIDDKYDNEIYENDILETTIDGVMIHAQVVAWHNDGYHMYWNGIYYKIYSCDVKIIGNHFGVEDEQHRNGKI